MKFLKNQKNLQKVPDPILKNGVCSELFSNSKFLGSSKRLHSSPFLKMESSGFDDNLFKRKAQISYFEIFVLVLSTVAFAYLLNAAMPTVSAVEIPGIACCEKTKTGNTCQYVKEGECDTAFRKSPTQCKNTEFCKPGCCFSTQSGWCNENVPQVLCSSNSSGKWTDNQNCNIKECERACCVIGNDAMFTTKRNCEVKSAFAGVAVDFRNSIKTELECIFLAEKDDKGACVMGEYDKTCVYITNEACKKKGGSFYKNTFCSTPSLNTTCIKQHHTGCVDKEDSVYWFDSCGNQEGISKECSLFTGSYCGQYRPGIDTKPVKGDYVCRDINCKVQIDGKTVNKKNGESWCEYEGTIGKGNDVPGSRHIRHTCFMGEERVEACEDYRNQICVQSDTAIGNGKTFSEAACRVNNWRQCLAFNDEKDKEKMAEKCAANPDCFVKFVDIDEYFRFSFCSPNYPPGFDLSDEEGGMGGSMVCAMGNQKCTMVYVKDVGGWDCKANCDCKKAVFTEKMNDLCMSLGDCGAKVNIAGQVTDDGYEVSRAPKLSAQYLDTLKKYARIISGQKAEPGNYSALFGDGTTPPNSFGSEGAGTAGAIGGGLIGAITISAASTISGALGTSLSSAAATIGNVRIPILSGALDKVLQTSGVPGGGSSPSSFGNAMAAGVGASIGSFLAMKLMGKNLPPIAALIASIVSSVVGTVIAVQTAGESATLLQIGFSGFVWALVIAIVIILVMKLFGIGKSKEKYVTFSCLPWQAPVGGKDCTKCNDYESCSAYKCQSLGQGCKLINPGTENQMCIDMSPNDVSSPKISPLFGTITEGFQYSSIGNNGFEITGSDKGCIPEFTTVIFGIKTDKPAQCKVDSDALKRFDEMESYFGGSNLYLLNHTTVLGMPSIEAFKNQYNLTQAEVSQLGDFNLHVKCKSANGATNEASYAIKSCVKPGPDLTSPYITQVIPASGSYIPYNHTQLDLSLWVNEPSDCKWSANDLSYEAMENYFACEKDIEDYSLYGWACNTTLTGLDTQDKVYLKCRDISENKNTMKQGYVYEFSKSSSALVIDDFRPVNGYEFVTGVEPFSFELEAKTSGGAQSGVAVCKWSGNGYSDTFKETGGTYHKYKVTTASRGDYNITISCQDDGWNIASVSTAFKITVDNSGPIVTRMYYEGGLKVITNEDAQCRYSFDKKALWENSTAMSGTARSHTSEWMQNTYYIQCKDTFENLGGKIAVKPVDMVDRQLS
jgi:hypothetical protein